MADIVLNRKDESSGRLQIIEQTVIEAILQRIIETKVKRINLHADWSEPLEFLGWFLEQLHTHNVHVTVCSNSLEGASHIDQYMRTDMLTELCLFKDESPAPGEDLKKFNGLKFFLPVDTMCPDGSDYMKVIDRIPPHTNITLGINWKNRLSGPEPMAETDYSAWADTIVTLLNILSKKKIISFIGCGLKLCIFSKKQLGQLPSKLVRWPIASCNQSYFYNVDGSLTPCMRLNLPDHLSFNHKTHLKDATVAFVEWLGPFTGHCMESDDLNCRCLKTNACYTGCIEHTLSEWQSV